MVKSNTMRLIFHGAAREVGRSCIEFVYSDSGGEHRYLFDAGFKPHGTNPELPTKIDSIQDVDGVFITHAHLDHIGALPYLHHLGLNAPLFMTPMTKKLTKIMLGDSFHLELLKHHHPAYDDIDVESVLKATRLIDYYHIMDYKGLEFEYIPSGHIPGSSMILFRVNGKNILYTGDINTQDTHLQHGLQLDFLDRHDVDVMISESTYGDREHKDRKKEESLFLESVDKTLKQGGSVLLPAFAIGRAQELVMIVSKFAAKVPIYLDGMAKDIAKIFVGDDLHIRNSDSLRDALKNVIFVGSSKQRHELLRQQAIIITTSGMVSGGPVMQYLKHFWHNEKNSILLTGFQGAHTNGRMLLEDGMAYVDGMALKFNCRVDQFDFSGHAGRMGILDTIKKVNPRLLIINHGSEEASMQIAKDSKRYARKVILPHMDSSVVIEKL